MSQAEIPGWDQEFRRSANRGVRAFSYQRIVYLNCAVPGAIRGRAAVDVLADSAIEAELIRSVTCRSAVGHEHAAQIMAPGLGAVLAGAIGVGLAGFQADAGVANAALALPFRAACFADVLLAWHHAAIVHVWPGRLPLSADRSGRAHPVIQACQRRHARGGEIVAHSDVRATASR